MANNYTKEQLNAINSRNSNILVSASAGSGKTAVLVERIIKRIIEENLEVDKILVVTFTKAAAGELKERIYKALKTALKKDPSNKHLKTQLKNLQIANITTIHSFCLEVIRSNFYKIGLDPNFGICDETKSKLLKKDAINEVLSKEYENSENQEFGLYNILQLFNMNEEEYIDSINKIWDEINCYIGGISYLKKIIDVYNITDEEKDLSEFEFGKEIFNLVISNISLALNKAESFRIKLEEKSDEFQKHIMLLDEDIFALKQIVNLKDSKWDKLYEILKSINLGQMPRNKVEDNDLKEEFSNLRKDVIKKEIESAKKMIYAKSQIINKSLKSMYKYLEYIYHFIDQVIKIYSSKKNDENLIDFTDIEHYALDILIEKDESGSNVSTLEAKNYIDKFDEIYIDEYQDTSYLQEELLRAISKEAPGNKFMVGDIKQSIYKFRHAAVDIFIEKYNEYSEDGNIKGKKIILAKNFRSRKEVLSGINYIFEQIMTEKVGACDYSGKEVLEVGNTKYMSSSYSYNTEINFLDFYDDNKSTYENEAINKIKELKKIENEAIHIASRIDKLVNKDKMLVMNKDQEELRQVKYSDICILLRSTKDKAKIYENALKNANIPSYSDSSSNLFEGDEVNLILSFLKVLDNPLNEIEMISIMYSIFGGFTIDEIYLIKSKNILENIYVLLKNWEYGLEKSSVLDTKIKNFLNELDKYISIVNVVTVPDIISKLYFETGLYDYALLLDNPNIRRVNLDSLITIASNINNSFNITEFLEYIENLKSGNINSYETSKPISENEDVVRIMTIHASKGLEFPVVILANTDKKYSTEDTKSKINLGKYGIGIDYIDEELKISYPTVIKEAIKYEIQKENRSEELRMLYVALTRAREKLIIYLPVNELEKKLNSLYISLDASGKIDSSITLSMNSYRDIIMLGLKKYMSENKEKEKNIFDINHIAINSEEGIKIFDEYSKNKLINIPASIEKINREEVDKTEISKCLDKLKSESLLSSKLEESYPLRTSVSKLKAKKGEEESYSVNLLDENASKYVLPGSKKVYSSARKGTITHLLLENFDYRKISSIEDVKNLIKKLIESNKLNEEDLKLINIDLFKNYLSSELFKEIKESKSYKQEVEFILKESAYSKSQIQGVIDLYYENNIDELVLVDFKTDNLESKQQFIDRYKIQLDIYKEALEKILNKKVKKAVIYSFKLNEEIYI